MLLGVFYIFATIYMLGKEVQHLFSYENIKFIAYYCK